MNIKDCTQTKDGSPVKIYEIYKDEIHGAIWHRDEWKLSKWYSDGQHIVVIGMFVDKLRSLDLDLKDWKEKIPWDCLRPEIKWVARDEDEEWFGFKEEPSKMDGAWFSHGKNSVYVLEGINMPSGPLNWTEAIAKRPE